MTRTTLRSPFSPASRPGGYHVLAALALSFGLTACDAGDDREESAAASPEAALESIPDVTSGNAANGPTPEAGTEAGCEPEEGIAYLCGPRNAEDLVQIGDSRWLLASGMNGQVSGGDFNGQIHLVDSETKTFEVVFPGEEQQFEQDMQMFPNCPGPVNVDNFSAHGLALRPLDGNPDRYRLYVTGHGAREAIEAFEVDSSADKPVIRWVGCVPMPASSWTNSVAILPDGGFYATQFIPAGSTIEPVLAGEITGHVFEWHPGEAVSVVEGTELSGANGIVIGDNADQVYVAAYGSQEVLRFDMSSTPPGKESARLDTIHPDNLRWTSEGTLYTAGGLIEDCGEPACGWAVMEIDPDTLQISEVGSASGDIALQGVSTALKVGEEIWLGTYAGDRLGVMPAPADQ